ncbi:MAG: replication initiation protein [Clostridiales bacterium]|nr:replication initiation protein [Clostridiales bacterium]
MTTQDKHENCMITQDTIQLQQPAAPETLNWGAVVIKSRELNGMSLNGQKLLDLRLMSVYLALINPSDINTREVRFLASDLEIMAGLTSRLKPRDIRESGTRLESPDCHLLKNGYESFRLFRKVLPVNYGFGLVIEMDVSDEAVKLFFNNGKDCFRYSLFDAMQMKSANQFRIYELMKEHSASGVFLISVDRLRWMLDLVPTKQESVWGLRRDVLDASKVVIVERTDVDFDYSGIFKGDEWEISSILFTVNDKSPYIEPSTIEAFMDDNTRMIDQALKKFMEDFTEARGISDSFYEKEAMALFVSYMKRIVGHTGEITLEKKSHLDKAMLVIVIKGKTYWIEIRHWTKEAYETRSAEKLFDFVCAHRQRVGWLLSFCPYVNPAINILTHSGRRVYEAVV